MRKKQKQTKTVENQTFTSTLSKCKKCSVYLSGGRDGINVSPEGRV